MNEEETARYDRYIVWKRLTHNGWRGRDQMSPAEQAEYDSHQFKREPSMSAAQREEAKRLYEEATRHSLPGTAASA
jgi:hypothetical protein